MSRYISYLLEDGTILLIEQLEGNTGIAPAGIGEKVQESFHSFDEALRSIKQSAVQLRKNLNDLKADEVKVKFGLKATGDVGNYLFAVGKVGAEANYEVTLKWDNKPKSRSPRKSRPIPKRLLT